MGSSRRNGDWSRIICWPEVGINFAKRALEGAVEYGDTNIEEGLHGPSVPAHLLFLDHASSHNFVDRALDEGCGDWLTAPATSAIVDQAGPVRLEVGEQVMEMVS